MNSMLTRFATARLDRWLVATGPLSPAFGMHRIDAATVALGLRHMHAVGRNPHWIEASTLP